MLLNNKTTISDGFNCLRKDPVMRFFIEIFGDEIDPLDRIKIMLLLCAI